MTSTRLVRTGAFALLSLFALGSSCVARDADQMAGDDMGRATAAGDAPGEAARAAAGATAGEAADGAPGEASAPSGDVMPTMAGIVSAPVVIPSSCLVVVPEEVAPESGWPVFVLMHGYGTNKEDFSDLARIVSERGAVAIAIDAPDEIGGGRRSWGTEIAATHVYIQDQIAPLRADVRFDFEPIHVGGFSQGGIRSLLLAAHYPEVYGGVLSISPAGGDWPASPIASIDSHPLRLVHGTAENAGILESAARAVDFWKEWNQPWEVFTHPGGHQFPGDWVKVLGEGTAWILAETAEGRSPR